MDVMSSYSIVVVGLIIALSIAWVTLIVYLFGR
jgi:hypothetical protein